MRGWKVAAAGLFMAACAGQDADLREAPEAEAVELGRAALDVSIGRIVLGEDFVVGLSGLHPRMRVGFRASTDRQVGACPNLLLGNCVEIGDPGVELTGRASSVGKAVLSVPVPPTAPLQAGDSVWVQLAAASRTGDPLGALAAVERRVACGDGIVGRGEQCDDGAVELGDGCDDLCRCEADQDADGVCDADDGCPEDVLKVDPELCGCGFDEAPPGGACPTCPRDELENCRGSCSSPDALGDGSCDVELDCEALDHDLGDCPLPPDPDRLVGGSGGGPGVVRLFRQDLGTALEIVPFGPSWTGGVRVAAGDINGDGTTDLVVGAGPGGAPHVKVYDGGSGALLQSYFAYDGAFVGGVFVATGDVNGDGSDDVVTSVGAGGPGGHVKVFDGPTGAVLQSFFAFDAGFTGGATVATGDVNGDARADLVVGAGPGAGPQVKVFSGADGSMLASFFAYAPGFTGGVFVAVGDVDGDATPELVTGAGASAAGGHVKVFDATGGETHASYFVYDGGFTGGVRVGAGDLDGDGDDDVLTAPGDGGSTLLEAHDGLTGAQQVAVFLHAPAVITGAWVASAPP